MSSSANVSISVLWADEIRALSAACEAFCALTPEADTIEIGRAANAVVRAACACVGELPDHTHIVVCNAERAKFEPRQIVIKPKKKGGE